jgi:hypothetical protein
VSGHANKNARFDQSSGAAYNVQAASAAPFLDECQLAASLGTPAEALFWVRFQEKLGKCWLNRETDSDCLRAVEDFKDMIADGGRDIRPYGLARNPIRSAGSQRRIQGK